MASRPTASWNVSVVAVAVNAKALVKCAYWNEHCYWFDIQTLGTGRTTFPALTIAPAIILFNLLYYVNLQECLHLPLLYSHTGSKATVPSVCLTLNGTVIGDSQFPWHSCNAKLP